MMISNFFGFALPQFTPNGKFTAQALNNQQYFEVFNRITNVALSRFKWNNLPKTCRPEILEMTLYFYGKALFMFDDDLGYIHTPVNLIGPFNIYYESIERHAFSFQYNKTFTIDDSVLIKANPSMLPDYLTTWVYTPKIANSLRAIDVHTETLKRPFLITCEEKEKDSVSRTIKKVAENEVAVVGQKIGQQVPINVLATAQTSYLPDMWANVKNFYNQVFTALGVKNNYTEKKERLITTEAEGEGNSTRHILESELYQRQLACERINSMYGLDISVEANELEVFTDELIAIEAARVSGAANQSGQDSNESEEE